MYPNDDRTPPDPFPAIRPGQEKDPIDIGHLLALQRWLRDENKETRRQHGEAMVEVRQRLTGIETQLGDGKHKLAKHDEQLAELIDQGSELDRRVGVVEAWKYAQIGERVEALEDAELARVKRETAESAALDERRRAEKQARHAGQPPWWLQTILSAALSVLAVAATIAVLKALAANAAGGAP